jgi:hypothetical protein
MKNKTESFVTETVEVKWSHLHKPDDKFGADASNHNITIILDKELEQKLEDLQRELGCEKINGMKEVEEGMTLKAKTKLYVKKNVKAFPCVDANANTTTALPFNGDKVKLKLFPIVISRDNSLSLFLNGIQIIEKNERDYDGGGFEATDGFDGSTFEAEQPDRTPPEDAIPADSDGGADDLPF